MKGVCKALMKSQKMCDNCSVCDFFFFFFLRAENGGRRRWVRNIKQFGEGRLSVFRPGELRTSGHMQKNRCDWQWVGVTQVTCLPKAGRLLLDSPSQEQSLMFHRAEVPDAASSLQETSRHGGRISDIKEPAQTVSAADRSTWPVRSGRNGDGRGTLACQLE